MLKIGVLAEMLSHKNFTGVEHYIYYLLKNLLKDKKYNTNAVVPFGALKKKSFDPEIFYYNSFFLKLFRSPFLSSLIHCPKGLEKFDIIHAPTVSSPFFRPMGVKVVMTVHDLFPNLFPQQQPTLRRLYFQYFLKYRFRYVDRFIAVSENTKKDLINFFNLDDKKIDVVYEGVSKKFKQDERSCKEGFILTVSTLEPRKNFKRLISAYIILKEKYNIKEKLYIVGKEGWSFKDIVDIPEKIKNDIVFSGYVSNEVLVEMYQNAKVFVYPSLYEGFGLPVLEAMACGCPVVTSKVASLPEVGGDAALFFKPMDINDIAEKMYSVLLDKSRSIEMSMAGVKQAEKFSWEKCAEETIKVYEKVMEN